MKFVNRETVRQAMKALGYVIKQVEDQLDLEDASGQSVMQMLGTYTYYGYWHDWQIENDFPRKFVPRDGFVENNYWVDSVGDVLLSKADGAYLAEEALAYRYAGSGLGQVEGALILTPDDLRALQNGKIIVLKRKDQNGVGEYFCIGFTEKKPEIEAEVVDVEKA